MNLYIPALGDVLKLSADWTFWLHWEHRNIKTWERFGLPKANVSWWGDTSRSPFDSALLQQFNIISVPGTGYRHMMGFAVEIKLPVGTELTVDRIYIKKGQPSFNSVTFFIHKTSLQLKGRGACRFWVKLDDVNRMEIIR